MAQTDRYVVADVNLLNNSFAERIIEAMEQNN